ncbi:hypothetical protein ANRL1_00121 [Anaerolineae bacterium]|nr:hypothetical protein ANRL1_00121 [Anaerolineae bacterium]
MPARSNDSARPTVRISKTSMREAELGHDTAQLMRERYETRRSAIERFTDRLKKTKGIAEPEWTAALREIGIEDDEINELVAQARAGS